MNEDDGLREAIETGVLGFVWSTGDAAAVADVVLALPEVAALRAQAGAVDRVRDEIDTWGDASREWYYAHRHDTGGTTYACGFEDGWDQADQLIRAALDGDPT